MSNTNTANTKGNNAQKPASIRLLQIGMTIHDNIYDSTGEKMLMAAGNVLTSEHLERIQNLNNGSDAIYVSGRTYDALVSKKPDVKMKRRTELEESTGYTSVLARVHELFVDITVKKAINRIGFTNAASDLIKLIRATPQDTLLSLVNAIGPGTDCVQRHLVNVGILNGLLGLWLDLPGEQVDTLVLIGVLHDCGHALMPTHVLYAPRKFTCMEQEVIKMHTVRTIELLSEFPDSIKLTAGSHHERIDGSGYPKGLSGDDVSGAARVTAVSDIYEGIVSKRVYRPSHSPFYALATLSKLTPDKIDNKVVTAIRANLPKLLIGRPVKMSDGKVGIVREYDPNNPEYPTVELDGQQVKTTAKLHCVSMYIDE